MQRTSVSNFLSDLKTGRHIRIKIFNLGENLGMDFAYYCHYTMLRKLFPNVELVLCRSNVDETNCIGLETYEEKVNLPVHRLQVAEVKQRYPDDSDWVKQLQRGNYDIIDYEFRDMGGYDYLCGIGIGESPVWLDQYRAHGDGLQVINTSVILQAIEKHIAETGAVDKPLLKLPKYTEIKPWARTLLEYMCVDDLTYPFTFTEDYMKKINPWHYSDYLRISLRWPDHVRWYYTIERQYSVVFRILKKIRAASYPVKVIYSLKDGEVGNNFNRGQTLNHLRGIQNMCDECIFTYSWTSQPYRGRLSEERELINLRKAGIKDVRKLDLWEDLLTSSHCKTYLSDPGGFAEIISILRRKHASSTFLFPVSFGHLCTYITLDANRQPIGLKVNPIVIDHAYDCKPTLSAPDDPEGYRTMFWDMRYKDDVRKIGENCHGDDWMYFEKAQKTVFKDWYKWTADSLVDTVVEEHLK